MNQLTASFFALLSKRVQDPGPLCRRLQQELLAEAQRRMQTYLREDTSYLSPTGIAFCNRFMQWGDTVRRLYTAEEGAGMYRQLIALCNEAEDLYRETRRALMHPGTLDAEQLHVIFAEEQQAAIKQLYEAICIEMYRIICAGGAAAVNRMPQLKYTHATLESYYNYYHQHVVPALRMIETRKLHGVWAYQFRPQAKIKNLIRLPLYVQVEPKKEKSPLLPGESHPVGTGSSLSWQGMGALTNITPDNIAEAQFEGIQHRITPDNFAQASLNDAPEKVASQCFRGKWYAIEPAHFFAVFNMVRCERTLTLRAGNSQCMFCGADHSNSLLCLSCLEKVRHNI